MFQARHRMWVLGLAIAGGAAGLLVAGLAHADPVAPTVTVTAIGAPPTACGTRPDVTSLAIPAGTAVVIGNRVGVPAAVVVGGDTVLTIDDGEGASLTLTPGQHEIWLVPQCSTVARTWSLVVRVVSAPPAPAGPSPSSEPPSEPASSALVPLSAPDSPPAPDSLPAPDSPPGPDAPRANPPGQVSVPGESSPAGSAASGSRTGSAGPPVVVDAPATAASVPAQASAGAVGPGLVAPTSGVLRAETVVLPAGDPKGVRLLAVIATICVLGVTVAIIRSIVRLDA